MRCPVCSSLSCPILARSSNHSCGVRFGGRSSSDPGEQAVYGECKVCGHVATDYFDGWPDRRFKEQIYNADYHIHDPGYVARRPKSTADAVTRFYSTSTRVLDYGSGSGLLPEHLSEVGVDAVAFDPMTLELTAISGQYDLLLCIEVLEHVPNPQAAAETLLRLAADEADIVVTTLLLPEASEHDYWWLGPRNGHIHAFSPNSLAKLFPGIRSFSPGVHYLGNPSHQFLEQMEAAVLCERV
ncbi:class I SAM-dependent methyltransferase [Tritonibacter sp. SIMBA_163]|uniref:class I SAM-dependent methyltransferase n=1 Tax=Tritonibacter sp. SIMBA_163 TaxID=3080868 RepID=UPI003980FAA4